MSASVFEIMLFTSELVNETGQQYAKGNYNVDRCLPVFLCSLCYLLLPWPTVRYAEVRKHPYVSFVFRHSSMILGRHHIENPMSLREHPCVIFISVAETQENVLSKWTSCFVHSRYNFMVLGRHLADHIMSSWKPLYLLCRYDSSLSRRRYREFILFFRKTTRCIIVAVTIVHSYRHSPHISCPSPDILTSGRPLIEKIISHRKLLHFLRIAMTLCISYRWVPIKCVTITSNNQGDLTQNVMFHRKPTSILKSLRQDFSCRRGSSVAITSNPRRDVM